MSDVLVEIAIIFFLILANGVFAMSEIAIVAARKTRLRALKGEGQRGAAVALELSESPERLLSTIQIGITMVGLLAGAFGGATLGRYLAPLIAQIPQLEPYAETIAVTLVVGLMAYFSLVLGELVPKRIALAYADRIACFVAHPMRGLSRLAAPLVWGLTVSVNSLSKLLGIAKAAEAPVTEEEIKIMLDEGAKAGVLESSEREIVYRVFQLGDRRVKTLMTLAKEIVWIDADATSEQNWEKAIASGHTYYPVCRKDPSTVLGIVSVKSLYKHLLQDKRIDLQTLLTQPLFVPESMTGLKLLEQFRAARKNLALVVNEFGNVVGVVTLSDILGGIVGEMPEQEEPASTRVVKREDGSWLFDGRVTLSEFKEAVKLERTLPGEDRGDFHTLGGYVMLNVGRVPREGDHFVWDGFRFEVVDMDGNRVDKILVAPAKAAAKAS